VQFSIARSSTVFLWNSNVQSFVVLLVFKNGEFSLIPRNLKKDPHGMLYSISVFGTSNGVIVSLKFS
jgi:hypothetical protein